MRLFIIITLVQLSLFGYSQNPDYIRYGLGNGLPTSNIYSSFEDSDGYIWLATDVGVLKFDGYSFKHYTTDDGLGDNEVFRVFEDSKNRLWFLSLNGRLSYYEKGLFYNGAKQLFLNGLSHSRIVMDVLEDSIGNLLFLFSDGHISVLDLKKNVSNIKKNRKSAFSFWKKDSIIHLLTSKGIITNNKQNILVSLNKKLLSPYGFRTTIENDSVFFASKNKVHSFHNNTHNILFEISEKEIIHLSKMNNTFIIGTTTGLIIKNKDSIRHFFKDDEVSNVLIDSQGNYWVSTLNDGIKFISNIDVSKYTFNHSKVNSLLVNNDGELLIGSASGAYIKQRGNIKLLNFDKGIKQTRLFKDVSYILGNNLTLRSKENTITLPLILNDILIDENLCYLATSSYVLKTSVDKLFSLGSLTYTSVKEQLIFNRRVNSITKGKNNIYIGSSTGLYTYKNNTCEKNNSSKKELNSTILDLFYNKETEHLLVATNSKGVSVLSKGKLIKTFGKKDGLNSNRCNSIKKINNNSYLIGTNKGVNEISFTNNKFIIRDYSNFLKIQNEKINDIEIVKDSIYLATDRGVLVFNKNKKNVEKKSVKIIIDNILVNNRVSVNNLDNLKHYENNISIKYTGISYNDFGALSYAYKFKNDTTWAVTTSRILNFKDLPDNKYELQIKTFNSSGDTAIKNINFTIHPPIWKTFIFIFIVIIIIFSLIILIIKNRIKSIKEKLNLELKTSRTEQEKIRLEKQTLELEQKAFRLQMNPHFMFNTLNTIKGYYSGGNIKGANLYISKFSKLLRLILENDEQTISLDREIEMLELYLKLIQLRYESLFEFHISISKNILTSEVAIPPLLLQPIIENAIIHGMAPNNIKGELIISFAIENNKLICIVSDNGIGFKAAKLNNKNAHQSKALNITKERIDFFNNEKNENNFIINSLINPAGTNVIIKLPILKLI